MDFVSPSGGIGSTVAALKPAPFRQRPVLLCLSHLRWNFVFQRPQHLMTRATRSYRVIYMEEPIFRPFARPDLETEISGGVIVATPILPEGLSPETVNCCLEAQIGRLLGGQQPALLWYYTPMAREFSRHLRPSLTIYDNMDELSLFHGADSRIVQLETEVMEAADIVFTGGYSLYEAKADRHPNIHAVPSSVDAGHFAQAKDVGEEPADQHAIDGTKVGFFGVIDERMDMELLGAVADRCPDLAFVMLGPVVKIDPASRPMRPNIHWLGGKSYAELPSYMGHWAAGFMPFAINDATRFISPTKTPEYLAAGVPVVSTPIRDVIRPWGELGLVPVASDADGVATALRQAMRLGATDTWSQKVANALARTSWDRTWAFMDGQIAAASNQEAEAHA